MALRVRVAGPARGGLRRCRLGPATRPEPGGSLGPVPTDRISRPGRAAAIVFFVLGTLALVNPAWLIRTVSGGRAAPAAYQAFAYDEGFLRLRGPVVLSLMIAGLVILAILLWEGRWRPWIRQAEMVHSLAVCAVLTWVVAAGPVFTATPTDRAMKGAASLIVLVTLIDLAVRTRRHRVRQAMEIRECPGSPGPARSLSPAPDRLVQPGRFVQAGAARRPERLGADRPARPAPVAHQVLRRPPARCGPRRPRRPLPGSAGQVQLRDRRRAALADDAAGAPCR